MKAISISRRAVLSTLPLLSLHTANAAFAQAETGTAGAGGVLEEVVVTASRRAESLQDIPIAVSAATGDTLRNARIESLSDLAPLVPNVEVSSVFTNANIAIRGIGNAQVLAGSESGVAFHSDGAFVAQPLLSLATFLDIERVEILRGPQGTLFGRNATGGAINVIPNRPTAELAYGMEASVGMDPGEFRSSGYLSGPLDEAGTVLARFAYQQTENDGYSRNRAADGPARLDDQSNYSARATLEWLPGGAFSTRLAVEYQRASDNGPAAYFGGTPDPAQPLPPVLEGQDRGDPDSREVFANAGARDIDMLGVTSVSLWELAGGELKALLYYNESELDTLQDGDGTAAAFTTTSYRNEGEQAFGELIYTSDASQRFSYVLGFNLFNESLEQNVVVPILGLPAPVDLGGDIETVSYSAFAAGRYDITPALTAFGGVRYTSDEKDLDEFNSFIGTLEQEDSWEEMTYEVGVSYRWTETVSGYLKYNTGFKGGGFSVGSLTPAFEPETNSNLEAGLKSTLFGDRMRLNLAAFYMEYEDLQVNQVVGVQSVVTNAAEATIYGGEFEFQLMLTDQLRLEGSGGWLDATFDEFNTADSGRPGLGILDLSGNRLPQAPEFSTSLGVYYEVPAFDRGYLTWGARYDWKSELYFSEFNLPVSSQDDVGKLDLSLIYRSDDERWTARLFALNATDETIRSNVLVASAVVGSLALQQYAPGRQLGASLSYRF